MNRKAIVLKNYENFHNNISKLVETARYTAARQVNAIMIPPIGRVS